MPPHSRHSVLSVSVLGILVAAGLALGQWSYEMGCSVCPKSTSPSLSLWLPPGAKHIRAILIVPENSDSYSFSTSTAIRNVGLRQSMAVLYLRCGTGFYETCPSSNHMTCVPKDGGLQKILDTLAAVSEMPEISHAPWITFGKSSQGHFPFFQVWTHPERVVAGITYHGEVPHCPPPDSGRGIPYVNVNGETEWEETWRVHVRPCLLRYRQTWGLVHMAVVKGVGHGDYENSLYIPRGQIIDYLAKYIEKAIQYRVPSDTFAITGPLKLRDVPQSTGQLVSKEFQLFLGNHVDDPLTMIRPYNDVDEEDRDSMFWVFDRELAADWLNIHIAPRKHLYYYKDTVEFWKSGGPLGGGVGADAGARFHVDQADSTCWAPSIRSFAVGKDGIFAAEMLCDSGVVPYMKVTRDIPDTVGVLALVNGADALLIEKILADDAGFKPEFYQLLAADVDLDGKVTSADLELVERRAVLDAGAYTQQGATGTPRDWLMVDWANTMLERSYSVSSKYPADDGFGSSRHRIPSVPACMRLPGRSNGRYWDVTSMRMIGVPLGDIDGSWEGPSSGAGVAIAPTSALVVAPVMVTGGSAAGGSVTSVDLEIALSAGITVTGVTSQQGAKVRFAQKGTTLRVTSRKAAGFDTGAAVITIQPGFTKAQVVKGTAFVNGRRARITMGGEAVDPSIKATQPGHGGSRPGVMGYRQSGNRITVYRDDPTYEARVIVRDLRGRVLEKLDLAVGSKQCSVTLRSAGAWVLDMPARVPSDARRVVCTTQER